MEKLFVISGGIFLSYAYFLAQKQQGSVEGIWMAIFIGIFIASLSNFILLIHASYLKERGSIDGCEPGILKWLMLLVLAFLYALFCILLRAFANASDLVLWLIGIIHRPLLNSAPLGLVLLQKVAQGIVVLLVTIV